MWTRIPYSARIGLPVRQYVGEAARKPILPPRKKKEKYVRNTTQFLISIDLGKVWPALPVAAETAACCAELCSVHCFFVSLDWSVKSDFVSAWSPTLRLHRSRCCDFCDTCLSTSHKCTARVIREQVIKFKRLLLELIETSDQPVTLPIIWGDVLVLVPPFHKLI